LGMSVIGSPVPELVQLTFNLRLAGYVRSPRVGITIQEHFDGEEKVVAQAPSPRASRSLPGAPVARPYGAAAAGVGAGVTAGLVWGLAFLLPVLLGGWNPVIVTVGR